VKGDVTLDGQPLKSGVIRFAAADGRTASAEALIADGKYSADMPTGKKQILVSSPKVIGKRKAYETPDSPTVDIVQEVLPEKYNAKSELTLTVTAGSQQKNYDLKSSK
jgi:hypothetical protein